MKVFSLVVLVVCGIGLAEPSYMKDGKISVTLKDGKTYSFSLNDYKVVPRIQETDELDPRPVVVAREIQTSPVDKNRVTIHVGGSRGGLDVSQIPGGAHITEGYGPVFGATFSRKIDSKYSLSATVLSNSTYLLGIGYDF